jgi:hypothetical protein
MIDYHWPCHVKRENGGLYRVSPVGMIGCDGTGATQDEAAEKARQMLQRYIRSKNMEALMAIGVYFHSDIQGIMKGEMIRLEVDLPT